MHFGFTNTGPEVDRFSSAAIYFWQHSFRTPCSKSKMSILDINMTENFSLKALVGLSDVVSYNRTKSIWVDL